MRVHDLYGVLSKVVEEHVRTCPSCLLVVAGEASPRIRCVSCGRMLWTA